MIIPATTPARSTKGITNLVATSNFPINVILGTKFLWWVLSIAPEKLRSSPGIRKNTDKSESTIAFARIIPISYPILNCINIMATMPETVVRELDEISGIAFDRATITASLASLVSCSSLNLLARMIA